MKIGIDVSQSIFGTGVSDYVINLVENLPLADPTNDYILFGSSLRRANDIKKLFSRALTYRLPPTLLHYLWNRLHVINIENFTGDVDVFHTSDWAEPPASSPKVTTVHDLSPFLYPSQMKSPDFRDIPAVHRARMHWVIKESAKIICVSQSTAAELTQLFKVDTGRISVIPEALPKRYEFRPTTAEVAAAKKEFGLSSYIMAVGTPNPRKNIPRLVSAFLQYQKKLRLPEKLIVVGGHGWGLSGIPFSPQVIFPGYLSDFKVASLMAGCSVLSYASLHEGFGLPILLGFHHQVPVVTSNTSSMPEVAGTAAVLVDPTSEEAIAHGLATAIKSSKKLIDLGERRLANYSWLQTAKETLYVYSQVC